jgi:voltage-gated potassium channel
VKAIWDQIWLAVRATARLLRHPRAQALATATVLYVAVGVGFYWWQEDWTLAESFYFSIVALTTVGFGDLHPTTTFTQLFTAIYLILGLGILGTMVHSVMQHAAGRLPGPDRDPTDPA